MARILLFSFLLPLNFSCVKENGTPAPGKIARVVSLSPSVTRMMIDLGCADLVVGITTYQPLVRGAETVGTLLRPSPERIMRLKPDVIFYSEEDSVVQEFECLTGMNTHRFKKNGGFGDIRDNYLTLAGMTGRSDAAAIKIRKYEADLDAARPARSRGSLALFVSPRPLVAVSGKSYIGSIIRDAGGVNVYERLGIPYSPVTLESLARMNPGIIIVVAGDAGERAEYDRVFSGPGLSGMRIFQVGPESISHYTPADYVESVRIISGILNKI
ncbi:MAG: ABC transporter substrate-binding protein [Spirochaetes bacterium]|jgi:ABC-type Fe3+-hydroxamate transport system substrate-binding protein|nr:ABC transporter substrate-binding protein [Spirochaetota bacterium]